MKSYDKQIVPNWWFIILSFVLINTLIYAIIGLFIYGYNLSSNKTSSKKSDTLYYDKLREHDEDKNGKGCLRCCVKTKNKVAEEKPEAPAHDFAVSYKDMETLLDEFHQCQAILKQ